jgi:hypothetical protein
MHDITAITLLPSSRLQPYECVNFNIDNVSCYLLYSWLSAGTKIRDIDKKHNTTGN